MTVSNLSFQLQGFEYSLVHLNERQEGQDISKAAQNIQKYYLCVIASIGIPANILAIIGVLSMGRLLPPAVLLLALSITDAFTLMLKLIANQVFLHEPHMSRLACRMEFVVICFSTLANWILVGIAVDRFLWLRRQRAMRNSGESGESKGIEKGPEEGDKANGSGGDEGHNVLCGLFRRDGQGYLGLTNTGVFGAIAAFTSVLMVIYGAVFFITRDVDNTGFRCVVYKKYVQFWKHGWYWINTGMFFFIPFGIILVLTVISVRWLLLDKREASRAKQREVGQPEETETSSKNRQDQKEDGNEAKTDNEKPIEATNNEADAKKEIDEQQSATNTKEETKKSEIDVSPGCEKCSFGGPFDLTNQTSFTAMMVLAAAFFLVLCLPGCVFYLSFGVKTDPTLKAKWLLFEQIQYILVDMSHALNFFIYFVAVKVFRDSLIRVLTCKGKGK